LFHGFWVLTGSTIARTIINKYKRALKSELDSQEYFEDLSTVPTAEQMQQWDQDISKAEELRTNNPEQMDIMAPRIPKGKLIKIISIRF
jgi:hypothetical protein